MNKFGDIMTQQKNGVFDNTGENYTMRKSQKRIEENKEEVRNPASKLVVSTSELRRIVREELLAVLKIQEKSGIPPQYKEQVIQDFLQQINRQNLALDKAKKGQLNKPD